MDVPSPSAPAETPPEPTRPADGGAAPLPHQRPLRQVLAFITMGWVFGAVWMSATSGAPLTLFAKHLGATEFQFGVLAALPFLASLLSLPASLLVERLGERPMLFFLGLYTQRFLWIVIAVLPLWIAWRFGTSNGAAIGVFLVLIFVMHASGAFGSPAWVSWMADVVPGRVRGRYFSKRRQLGILTAVPTAILVGWLLDRQQAAEPMVILTWCSLIFLAAMAFGVVDIALFHFVPHEVKRKPSVPLRQMLMRPLRDRQFMWFGGFVGVQVFAISFMGQFVTLYLIQKLQVSNTGVQLMLLAAPMAAQLLVLPTWGRLVDRMGKKPALTIASLGLVPVGMGWVLMNSGAIWLGYLLSAAGAALWAGVEVANTNLVLEFSSHKDGDEERGGASYIAMNTVIINIAGCLGGLLSGVVAHLLRDFQWDVGVAWLAPFSYFEVLFLISAVLRLAAVVIFLPYVQEPDAKPTLEAVRFMTGNFYNNLNSVITLPLKLLRRGEDDEPMN
jgi:MFS family permease